MVFNQKAHQLIILAGQRQDKYLSDMHAYDIATDISVELTPDFTSDGGPEGLFSQRAVIDPELGELYLFVPNCFTSSNNPYIIVDSMDWSGRKARALSLPPPCMMPRVGNINTLQMHRSIKSGEIGHKSKHLFKVASQYPDVRIRWSTTANEK
jgi:hypothetical protein